MRVIAASLLVVAPALVSAAVTPVRRSISGFATYYFTETGNPGSCGDYLHDTDYTVAMNSNQYNQDMCGKTVTITANGKTTQATVKDLCPEGGGNCHYGDMDLSPSLFSFFANLNDGKIPIQWDFADGSAPATTPPTQDSTPYVEPPAPSAPSAPPVENVAVYENAADVTTSSEVAPAVEPTPTQEPYVEPYVEPTPAPWTESTETTTESATSTETSAAAATTTPTFGEMFAQAIKDGNVDGLGQAFLDLGFLLKNSTDSTEASY